MTDQDVPSPPTVESVLQGAPAPIADLSAAACQYVARAVGVELDYTPETLPILDHYVTLARQEIAERPSVVPLVARALGAYFGQVAVRVLDGFWRVPSDDDHLWLVCLRPVLLAFGPVGIAYDVLLEGGAGGSGADIHLAKEEREVVFARLESLPQVAEAEYFTFATRLEALEIASAALHTLESEATADVQLQWEDYQSIVPGAGSLPPR